jgi:hypothetical protein
VSDPAQGSVTVGRMLVGARLRRLREDKGIPRAEAGYVIRASESKMSRLELGRVTFKERDVSDLLVYYGVTDPTQRHELLELVRKANRPGWWREFEDVMPGWFANYVGLEEAATTLRTYETHFIPGLLQTPDYAGAVLASAIPPPRGPDLERGVRLRMTRQRVLTRPSPLRVWAVVDEAALRRQVGGPEVYRRQLEHLLQIAGRPGLALQVLPIQSTAQAGGGAFSLLRFDEPDVADVVYVEQLLSAVYIDKPEHVASYAEVFTRLSIESLTPQGTMEHICKLLTDD